MTLSLAARRGTLMRVCKECQENFLPFVCGTYSRSPVRPVMLRAIIKGVFIRLYCCYDEILCYEDDNVFTNDWAFC